MSKRPLIGCGTYRKTADQDSPIELFGLMPVYVQAVLNAGGLPVLLPLSLSQQDLHDLLPRLDGILLPGGGDMQPSYYGGNEQDPTVRDIDTLRDAFEVTVIRHAVQNEKPILAICRGLQVFNVALGGSLWEDVGTQMPGAVRHDYFKTFRRDHLAHDVTVQPNSLLHTILGADTIAVNSLHHQGIRNLAPDLRASAVAPDNLIEAVEVDGHPFAIGVQWHPEQLLNVEPRMGQLFHHFVAAAGANGAANGAANVAAHGAAHGAADSVLPGAS